MKSRLDWIDGLKGISIFLVVYMHVMSLSYSIPFNTSLFDTSSIDRLNYLLTYKLAPLRMPLFFLISGFLASKSIQVRAWGEIVHSKIGLYVYVFILWAIIQNLVIRTLGGEPPVNSPLNALYAENVSTFVSLIAQGRSGLWYLYALVIYFVLTKTLVKYPFLLLIIAMFLNLYSAIESPTFPYRNMTYCYLFFIVGVYRGHQIFKILQNLSIKQNIVIIVFALTVVITLRGLQKSYQLVDSVLAITILSLAVINLYRYGIKFRFLSYIGKNTLPIYIIHRPLLEVFSLFFIPWYVGLDFVRENEHFLYSLSVPILLSLFCVVLPVFVWRFTNVSFGRYLYNYR